MMEDDQGQSGCLALLFGFGPVLTLMVMLLL